MINKGVGLCFLGCLVLLTGCNDQRILEETGFIQSASYDELTNNRIVYGISIPIANPEIKATRAFLMTDAMSSKQARTHLSRQTNLQLVSGQLRVALFGLPLAKKGIWRIMDTLIRDPTISEKIKIIIVNGEAAGLLKKNFKEFPRTGQYIDRLIKKEAIRHSTPLTTLYSFSRDYYDDGIDPVVPIIKDTGKTISLDGIALFQDDTYKGKINPEEAVVFAILRGNFKQGEVSLALPKQSQDTTVMLSSLNSSRKVNVKYEDDGNIRINIQIQATATVSEYIGELKLSNDAERREIERVISDQITEQAERILKTLQRFSTDSLGLGTYVRNSMTFAEWQKLNWHDQYPNVNIECRIKLRIKDYGFRR
ncbi:Ger(x)C family spore germination protein [Paenibacillus mendelii]|uniref:Ger(X)C family spore germination protein n=1 Tax=Paenibacillus mendelii TaxID=206163 RepID=A0ABV6J4Y5_9BACL|nr:Ger(x)C family spore germination protein [Paenibacillus mendelii]MCQ6562800.1 Ger(x)C family spore germination protein [Paenibacillus mendelii]